MTNFTDPRKQYFAFDKIKVKFSKLKPQGTTSRLKKPQGTTSRLKKPQGTTSRLKLKMQG